MVFPAVVALAVGLLMVGQWAFFLLNGQVPELETEPRAIRFHLAAEFVTTGALVAAGLGLLLGTGWGRSLYLVATGMLLYTLVNSPGYFAQRGQWALVGMFAVLLVLALAGLALVF